MRNPDQPEQPSPRLEGDLSFALAQESRWRVFWENLKGFFVKAVASSVSATPVETDLLLASFCRETRKPLLGRVLRVFLASEINAF